jgi:hypothetical protein
MILFFVKWWYVTSPDMWLIVLLIINVFILMSVAAGGCGDVGADKIHYETNKS